MQKKKQPAKKIVNVKSASKLNLVEPESKKDKDYELELLALIILVFDNWSKEQKERNLKYLVSRYYDFM